MKKNNLKKIVLGIACTVLVFSTAGFIVPQKAHAQELVEDIHNGIVNTLSSIENAITSVATTDQFLENSVLNKIATAIAKQLLMQITNSVISWINSGFNGNPSFIQNPTAFFENIGDQATGQFISQSGALSSLCSPFSLQVRLAIAQQQQRNDGYGSGGGGGENQYSCTLSTIIQNGKNAINSAGVSITPSVQGFTGGDFSQGGWGAFSALVTNPDNTPNGAYLDAEDQLQQQINNQVAQKQSELSQGGGFLSWESCTPSPSDDSTSDSANDGSDETEGSSNDTSAAADNTDTSAQQQQVEDLQTQLANLQQEIQGTQSQTSANQYEITDETNDYNSNCISSSGILSNSSMCMDLSNQISTNKNKSYTLQDQLSSQQSQQTDLQNSISALQSSISAAPASDNSASDNSDSNSGDVAAGGADDPYGTAAEDSPNQDCSIQTPGSVISATLNKHLAVPTENLELANSINDIINAAFSELITMALQKGLTSVSHSSSGGQSYLQSSINSADSASFSSSQDTIINGISPYLGTAQTVYNNYNSALNLATTAESTLNNAISCYQVLETASTTTRLHPYAIPYMQGQITTLQNLDSTSLSPLINAITDETNGADSTVQQYQQISDDASNAQSLSDLEGPNQDLSDLSSTGSLPTAASVQTSANDLSTYQSEIQPMQQQADTTLRECQNFNYSSYGTNASGGSYIQ